VLYSICGLEALDPDKQEPISVRGTDDVLTHRVSGLLPRTNYRINILVTDKMPNQADLQSVYTVTTVKTLGPGDLATDGMYVFPLHHIHTYIHTYTCMH